MSQYGVFNPTTDAGGGAAEGGGGLQKPTRREPGRGMLDGIRKDLKAAKTAGESYDPRGTSSAWSHSFLQKKPWHPLTFRNMAVVYEKEQEHYETEKKKADTKAEFEAEQQYLKTLSLLSPEEQEKYRQRQSVSFLYMKPPGYDAALERAERATASGAAVGPGGEALPPGAAGQQQQGGQQGPGGAAPQQQQQQGQQQGRQRAPPPGGHVMNMMEGIKAAAKQAQRYELKHAPGGVRSPPRGGTQDSALQQFVVGDMPSDEEEEAIRLAVMPPGEHRRLARAAAKQRRKAEAAAAAAQLDQAKAFLRAAGLALPSDDEGEGGSAGSSSSSSSSSGTSGSSGSGEEGRAGHGKKRRQQRHGSQERKRSHGGSSKRHKRRKKERKEKRRKKK